MAKGSTLKHRLYDAASGRFFVRNGEWTDDESAASTFSDFACVIQLCLRYGLKDAQLQVRTDSGRRIRVPICA
jgi:hypothetical protein